MTLILTNDELYGEWKRDISTMASRIIAMRKELHRLLTEEFKTPGNWDHIIKQIGMFRCVEQMRGNNRLLIASGSFTGISPEQSRALVEQMHVYLTNNGRISMAGLNSANIRYFAASLDKIVRSC